RNDRKLPVDIWYPADPRSAATASKATYTFIPGLSMPSTHAVNEPMLATGRFPVVVYSHGSSGFRYVSSFLTEHLASHGFIVVAPDHVGNTAIDVFLGNAVSEQANAEMRPLDVSFVLDNVLAESDVNPVRAHVDRQRVGVIGHSFGGYTAMSTVAGSSTRPADARVKAIVGMAPYTRSLDDATLANVRVPALLMTGTKDTVTPIVVDTTRPWDRIAGRPLYRVDLLDAGHQSFTDACAYVPIVKAAGDLPAGIASYAESTAAQGCGPGLMDISQAQLEINKYITAFLGAYVAGNTNAKQYLVSDPPLVTVQEKRA
ncbi:MAG: alpha/beta hydrolase family protein, partial [Acidimicrobiia bacterium]